MTAVRKVLALFALVAVLQPVAARSAEPPAAAAAAAAVDERRLAAADSEPGTWFTIHRAGQADHFSPLTQIDESNVGELGYAWSYATHTTRGLEATPLVVDGVMYTSGPWGRVYALDARSGEERWTFDPEVPGAWGRRPCCDIVNRGVAVWKGRVYVASLDARLFALDAATGKVIWVRDTLIDHKRFQPSTGAPQIAGNKVVIGNAGAELGVRGYISAYDVDTGQLSWRFFTVPGDPRKPFEHPELALAAKTWSARSAWDIGGGGTVWDAMAYDPVLNLLYVGVGNGSPHPVYSRSPGGGDTLFVSSILAINPDTGRMKWYYQTTPGESYDFTATQQIVLADLKIQGRARQVLMQAPKNGFYYVLDRATGELLSAKPYGTVNWASGIDPGTGRPRATAQGDFSKQPKLIYPGQAGAHNWRPMSFSPQAGLTYIPVIEQPMVFKYTPSAHYRPGRSNQQDEILDPSVVGRDQRGSARVPVHEMDFLVAYDPVAQREVWRAATSASAEQSGGVLATAGNLVFQGDSTGFLHVYAADTGAPLAHLNVGTSIMAAPMSYSIDGVQYVAVMAGLGGAVGWVFPRDSAAYRYGNEGRIVVFHLGGGRVPLPARVGRASPPPPPPTVKTSPAMIARGERLFVSSRCSDCHGNEGPGLVPDLLAMPPEKYGLFRQIVLGGLLERNGMASFADLLTESDVDDIQAYLADAARRRGADELHRRP